MPKTIAQPFSPDITSSVVLLAVLLTLTLTISAAPAHAAGECKEFYKEFAAQSDFKVMVKGKKKGQWWCWWNGGFSSLEEAKKSLLGDCKKEAKSCVVEYATDEKKYFSKLNKGELCKKALATGASAWDGSALYAKYVAEAKRRSLSLDDCRAAIGASSTTATTNDPYQKRDDVFICRAALAIDHMDWNNSSGYVAFVGEAKRRGLSIDECRAAIGVGSTTASANDPYQKRDNVFICRAALAIDHMDWNNSSGYVAFVVEAKRRGLTVDDCRVAIGLEPFNAPSSQKTQLAEVISPPPQPLSLIEVCKQSLNSERTDWSSATSATEARKQADALGITVGLCRVTLGIRPEQKIIGTSTTDDQTVESNIPASPTTLPQKKVALVIGNGNYQHSPVLANPHNDAEAVASALSGLGFEVIKGLDLGNSETVAKVREFAKSAKTADLSLLYYAGHGLQIAGENYIVPVDAVVEDETAISFEFINVSTITNFMGGLDKVGVVLLDACRDNPFSRSLKRSLSASRAASVEQGLAPISAEGGGLFVAFSTAPGDVAADGEGMTNSPFTTALLKHLPTKGLEINTVMTRVKAEVAKMTKNDQRPWTNSDLTTEVYLAPVQ